MRQFYLFFVIFLLSLPIFSQSIAFVKADVDKINSQILITYNLDAPGKSYDKYVVDVYYSTDKGKTFSSEPLKYVSGDVGLSIERGIGKVIVWNYFMENADFDGKNLVFKLTAKLDKQAEEARILGLGGPEKALYSVVVPGMGDYQVRSGKRYWMITAGVLGTMAAGTYFGIKSQNLFNKYQSGEGKQFYNSYQSNRQIASVLITTAATAWLADVVIGVIKGSKNKKAKDEIMRLRQEASKE
jgi:hypothetical protein